MTYAVPLQKIILGLVVKYTEYVGPICHHWLMFPGIWKHRTKVAGHVISREIQNASAHVNTIIYPRKDNLYKLMPYDSCW